MYCIIDISYDFKIIQQLGSGTYGDVYEVSYINNPNVLYAIKMCPLNDKTIVNSIILQRGLF